MHQFNFTKSNCHVILYISSILFRKYQPYLFPAYMLKVYLRIRASNFVRQIHIVPDLVLFKLLKEHYSEKCYDPNNCVIISKKLACVLNVQNLGIIAVTSNDTIRKRFVQVFVTKLSGDDNVTVSETLAHNLGNVESCKLKCSKISNLWKTSVEVDISLINTCYNLSYDIIDVTVKNYFHKSKVLYKGDLISISLAQYAPQFFYDLKKANHIDTIHFKCNKIRIQDNDDFDGGCLCNTNQSSLNQSPNTQSYLPKRDKILKNHEVEKWTCISDILLNSCPNGLREHLKELERAVLPFLNKNAKLCVKPTFLIQGSRGCGKNLIVKSLAAKMGLHFHRVSNAEVSASLYAQTESKLHSLFFKVRMASPIILAIDHFEDFGKNNEGQYDQRIIYTFQTQVEELLQSNNFPIILICLSNSKDVHVDLKRTFLAVFDIPAPIEEQRVNILKWLIDFKNVCTGADLKLIASKCYGFCYEDLDALVYHATKFCYEENEACKSEVKEKHFVRAVEMMQASYSQSIGAPKVPKVQWSDIGGLDDIKAEIMKTIQLPLKHPEFFKKSGLKRSGILLYGPPGTGKTLIAKAVATECNLCFLSIKGPELLNMYVGQSEQNIRDVFQRAREASPCIIFFDELDSLAPNRGISGDSGGVMDRVVSQILAEMDGLDQSGTVFIIGATNRPDLIDPALLRPGRFDKLLYVGPALDFKSKVSILRALTRKFNFADDVNLEEVVKECPENITGADYYGLCSNAWMSAVRRAIQEAEKGILPKTEISSDKVEVNMSDFFNAAKSIKPSVKPQELRYFEKLKQEFSSTQA